MEIQQFHFNPLQENTYVVYDNTGECIIIDPGCFFPEEKKQLSDFINKKNLTVKYLINTHLHFDHIMGSTFVEEKFGLLTLAHPADEFLLTDIDEKLQKFGFPAGSIVAPTLGGYIYEGDKITFGEQLLTVLEVPGHSPGHVVFYSPEGVLFAGDTLFKGSIGRTDLEGGDYNQLINGIHKKLLTLPPDTIVCSGHGPNTTIGQEQRSNPFLQ